MVIAVVAHQGETTQLAVIFFNSKLPFESAQKAVTIPNSDASFIFFDCFTKAVSRQSGPKNVKPGKTTDQQTTKNICARP